jgi:enediyne biosynthesis protein E4
MPAPSPLKPLVTVLFCGLLCTAWWLDRQRIGSRVELPAEEREALQRFGFWLHEVAAEHGVNFVHQQVTLDPALANVEPHVAAMGAGVSVCDVNRDGRPDLYFTNSAFGSDNALFVQQEDGSFRDEARAARVTGENRAGEGVSMAAIWADADNDGDEDLWITKWGYGRLLRNELVPSGELLFTDVTQQAGLRRWMNANSAVWFDYDRDGLVDLYVAGYFSETVDLWKVQTTRIMQDSFEFATNGGHNVLWRNLGPDAQGVPRFEDVTARTGADSTRWTLALAAADFDGDGWPDLYLANDYGPEELLRSVEGQRFELASVGLGEDSKSGMSVTLGDTRNAGRLDVYVTNICKNGYLYQGNNLRLNDLAEGGGLPNIAQSVVADCGWAWGAQFGDLDNDGWLDLFVTNGFISADRERDYWYDMSLVAGAADNLFQDTKNWAPIGDKSLSGYERSRVLKAQGGRYADVAAAVGVTDLLDGRAVALADLWNRGVLDVIVANQKGPALIYRNEVVPGRGWIGFELKGSASNRSAIGARVTLRWSDAAGEHVQSQLVEGGTGFCSQNDRRLHFGLGPDARVLRAEIRWPSGADEVLEAPAAGSVHAVTEGAP